MNLIIVVVGVGVSLLTIKQTVSTGHNYADFLNFTQGVDLGGIKKCLNGLWYGTYETLHRSNSIAWWSQI